MAGLEVKFLDPLSQTLPSNKHAFPLRKRVYKCKVCFD